jgi:polyisoprenyl-phosphate glycosyltransferase
MHNATQPAAPLHLSVVVPTYGRAASLAATIGQLHGSLHMWMAPDKRYEIILVDDASPDGTEEVVRGLCLRLPEVRGILMARNCGQQNATLAGIRMAAGQVVVTMDDDRKNDPRDISRLLAELEAGYDVVYGVPEQEPGTRLHRRVGTRLKEWLLERMCGKPPDVRLTSFRAMNRRTADRVAAETRRQVYLSATILQQRVRIGQVPVREAVDAVAPSGYRFSKLVGQLWQIAVQYGRHPLARLLRSTGDPCPVREFVACD